MAVAHLAMDLLATRPVIRETQKENEKSVLATKTIMNLPEKGAYHSHF